MTSSQAERQAAEYAFPYHHLSHVTADGRPRLGRNMRGGMEYLAYIAAVVDAVRVLSPQSVLDVGCGDGRLLAELAPHIGTLRGVDLDARAVAYAGAFVPEAVVTAEPVEAVIDRFDVVTCVETLEHLSDELAPAFLAATAACVRGGGHLVVTVPSTSRPVAAKHFRHYDTTSLADALAALPGRWDVLRLEELVPHRRRREPALRLVSNRLWTLDLPWWNARILRDLQRPVRKGERGQHVLAVLRRVTAPAGVGP